MQQAVPDGQGRRQRVSAWTGGQFSLVRAVTGIALWVQLAGGLHHATGALVLGCLGSASAVGLILGYRTRWSALAVALACLGQALLAGASLWSTAPLALAGLAFAAAPVAPFGSWEGRGRVDPAGPWRLPQWIPDTAAGALALWLVLGGSVGAGWLQGDPTLSPFGGDALWAALGACAGLLLILSRPAGGSWALAGWALAGLGSSLALLATAGTPLGSPMVLALPALLLAFDPRWLPDRSEGWVDTVFYDGSCGLCHGAVRWLLAEDPEGARFRYAPLGGEAFLAAVPPARRTQLPDSILVRTPEGALLDRSAAIGRLLSRLGGLWGLLGLAWGCLPRGMGDLAYAAVARVRHRLAEAPNGACPLLTPDLGRRFAP